MRWMKIRSPAPRNPRRAEQERRALLNGRGTQERSVDCPYAGDIAARGRHWRARLWLLFLSEASEAGRADAGHRRHCGQRQGYSAGEAGREALVATARTRTAASGA